MEHHLDKIRYALQAWKRHLLSFVDKLTLLKSILTSILMIYSLASAEVPKAITQRIEQLMAQFLWSGERRLH